MDFSNYPREESVKQVVQWATAYYSGKPEVPDHTFEALVAHIAKNWPTEPVINTIGYGYEADGVKRPHKVPTNSLPKIQEDEFDLPDDSDLRVTPKYDGMSCVLYYDNGRISDALTRGGGKGTGKPILHNLYESLFQQRLVTVDTSISAISGEVIVSLKDFEETLSDDYDLPRSAAAGIDQTQTVHPYRLFLQVQPFRIHFTDGRVLGVTNVETEVQFKKIIPFAKTHQVDHPIVLKTWINSLGYPTDGAVLWDETALKFETEKVETVVTGIRRKTSRLGKIIPVLELEPRKLYGTTVQKVTMNNEGWVIRHKVGPGAKILITKANEIIPEFLETLEPVSYDKPTECPACDGPVVLRGDHLLCQNDCMTGLFRPKRFIWTFASLLGYADSVLTKILENNQIQTFDDLLKQIGFLQDSGLTDHEKIFLVHLNKAFKTVLPLEKLLISLNIPGVGESWSVNLAPYINSWILNNGPRPPFTVNTNVEKSIFDYRDLIEKVYNKFVWGEPVPKKDEFKVTITGKLMLENQSITKEEFCKRYGITQAPIKTSKILICSDKNSNSDKMKTARKIGAEILTAEEFIQTYCQS
jgi:NAD-dependent DNA ligase